MAGKSAGRLSAAASSEPRRRSGSKPCDGCSIGDSTAIVVSPPLIETTLVARHVALRGGAAPALEKRLTKMRVVACGDRGHGGGGGLAARPLMRRGTSLSAAASAVRRLRRTPALAGCRARARRRADWRRHPTPRAQQRMVAVVASRIENSCVIEEMMVALQARPAAG